MTEADVTYWRGYARATAANLGVKGDDLDDIAQDCLITVIAAWNKPQGDRHAYLSRVVRNCVIDALRKSSLRKHESLDALFCECDDFPSDRPWCSAKANAPDESELIDYVMAKQVIADAGEYDNRVLELFATGQTDAEIASHLSTTPQAVKIVLARVRRQLRRTCAE